MKILIGFCLALLLYVLFLNYYLIPNSYKSQEYGYFEGQRDALNGDIRIQWTGENYIWIKSCWNDGRTPVYDPTKVRSIK